MEAILLLTVGGSHQPILQAIEDAKPLFISFLCSDDVSGAKGSYHQVVGQGMVLKSKSTLDECDLPNIKALAELSDERFEVIKLPHFDSLESCYEECRKAMESLAQRFPNARRIADYTGGTKSMSAGLAAAALDDETWEIRLVAGERRNLIQVLPGTQFSKAARVGDLRAKRRQQFANEFLKRFDYAAALHVYAELVQSPIGSEMQEMLSQKIALCRAFDAWDRFDHEGARTLLEPFKDYFPEHWRFLRCLLGDDPPNAVARAEDMMLNTIRRETQGRFDDAIARFYRSLEFVPQIVLRYAHGVDTADEELGLAKSYERLLELGDPLGKWYQGNKGPLLNWLLIRNQSILAHGFHAVTKDIYGSKGKIGLELCRAALDVAENRYPLPVKPVQLPTSLELVG